MKIKKYIITVLFLSVCASYTYAQEAQEQEGRRPKAFELGVGGSVLQFNRVTANYSDLGTDGHMVNLKLQHVVYAGNLYLAKELSRHFALDLQATLGATKKYLQSDINSNDVKYLFQGGLGLQWRLNSYFNSKYIVPYLRVGANYMYKGFVIDYSNEMDDSASWELINNLNKEGADREHSLTVAAGFGINMWLNDRVGIGLQGDYLVMPYKNVANSLQGTVRVMFRFGGGSLKSQDIRYVTQYVDVVKEVPVEVVVEVEKPVAEQTEVNIYDLVANITFDFNESVIKDEYRGTIAQIAQIMKDNTDKRFLVTGYTDIRGSESYNAELSERRARAIKNALVEQGVPEHLVKSRGVGKKIAYAPYGESDRVREGDRKTTIEVITNMDYWSIIDSDQ